MWNFSLTAQPTVEIIQLWVKEEFMEKGIGYI